jgi:hypothetical protein
MAGARHARCPQPQDFPGWLFLMQHYGLPTRLLDWTEAMLVAVFFAVQGKPRDGEECDGVLWALDAARLNDPQGRQDRIHGPRDFRIHQLFDAPFTRQAALDTRIVAVGTEQTDPRHMAQHSVFTLHGCDKALDEHPEANEFLIKLVIGREAKEEIRRTLAIFGVNLASLFPDLDNLAAFLDEAVCAARQS